MNLYRITVKADLWYQGTRPVKPLYTINESKEEAKQYVEKHLKDNLTVVSISLLGRELGAHMFSGNKD